MPVGTFASAVHIAAVTAFPVVATTASQVGATLSAGASLPLPAGIVTGDLLICCFSNDGNTPLTLNANGAGWTPIVVTGVGTVHRFGVYGRVATGSPAAGADAIGVDGSALDYSAVVMRVTGHGVAAVAADIKVGSAANATAGQADPPSLNTGTTRKWLWLAACAHDLTATGDVLTAPPAGYTEVFSQKSAASTSSSWLAVARRDLEIQTENPDTFTATARPWVAATVAIPPS